ncbi:Uncharacterised protein [Serratia fonticola]|uniref:Uncharacterized protein n=1 Tax=Serratia fonticola TaxID=47917 RepID=A0A4U9U2P9_SERFO|nr:Uncharacterised protein [Serratia fonticola]
MKRVIERDDLVLFSVATIQRMFSRQLQRGLVGFRAGVTEKYLVGKGGINQLFGQA